MPVRRLVVTGGPGAGKTTLLAALAARGCRVHPEAGRAVLRAQAFIGGPAGHAADRALFAELMLSFDMRSHAEAGEGLNFYDRGAAELVGYHRLVGLPVPGHFIRAAGLVRYDDPVFLAPAWEAIYANDTERRQDFAEAVETERAVAAAWREFGYGVVPLPLVPVGQRADFVLENCR